MLSKRILVTGERGFIGTNLVRELGQRGHYIVNDRVTRGFSSPYDVGMSVDVRSSSEIDEAVGAAELVIHLAARKGSWFCDDDERDTVDVNMLGSLRIAKACERGKRPLIYFGTTAYYDSGEAKLMHSEHCSLYPRTLYGVTKLTAEQSIAQYDTFHMVIRPVYAYGNIDEYASSRSESWPDVILTEIRNGRTDPLKTDLGGQYIKDYTHISDIIRATIQLIDLFDDGEVENGTVVQIGAGGNYRFRDVVDAFAPRFDVVYDESMDYKKHQAHHYGKLRDLIGFWNPINILEYASHHGAIDHLRGSQRQREDIALHASS